MDVNRWLTGQMWEQVVVVATVASLIGVIIVGNWASSHLGSETTRWDPTSFAPRNAEITEHPGPEDCMGSPMPDETYLDIYRLGTYVRDDADATLPDGAINTGWHAGGRQLWIEPSIPADATFERDTIPPDAVYVVSAEGVERWLRKVAFCF
jgi:hypothetical protein